MLYLFHGTDTTTAHTKAHQLVEVLKKKQPDAAYMEFDVETLTADALDAVIVGQGLFVSKYIVRLRDVCGSEEGFEMLKGRLKDIAESPHVFVCAEGKLAAPTKKKLEKHAEKAEEFSYEAKKETRSPFALTDAVARRDAKGAWVLYRSAIEASAAPEEVHGMLFWQMKSIVGAGNAAIPEEAGMKAFPFKKAQEELGRFGKEGAERKMWELVKLYHDARRGMHDLSEEMERWILNISH